MKVIQNKEITQRLEQIAPLDLAESWDNVGLILGDINQSTEAVVLSLDTTFKAIDLCRTSKAKLLITHHPLLFSDIKTINYNTSQGLLIKELIENEITVYCAHTNLDKSHRGVNQALAQAIDLPGFSNLHPDLCGLTTQIEMTLLWDFLSYLRPKLEFCGVLINTDYNKLISKLYIQGGAFDEASIPILKQEGIDFVISGEIKHHQMLELENLGIAAVAIGHDVSERVVLPSLKQYLQAEIPDLNVAISAGLAYNKIVF